MSQFSDGNLSTPLKEVEIPVTLASQFTANVTPLLHQIRHALTALLDTGQTTTIDLRGIPLAPGEETRIESALGKGELKAELNSLGRSDIIETAYPGVWLISHFNTEDVVVGKTIEVTFMPDIMLSQQADIEAGLEKLSGELEPVN